MAASRSEIEDQLKALSAEIGRRKRQGLPADDLIARHRELRARLEELEPEKPAKKAEGPLVLEERSDIHSEEMRAAWTALFDASNAFCPSMCWEWLSCWHELFASKHQPCLLTVKQAGPDRLVGLLPLVQVSPLRVRWWYEGYIPCRHLGLMGTRLGAEVEYTYPLIAADCDRKQVAKILLEAVAAKGLPLVANHWDGGDNSATLFHQTAHELGFTVYSETRLVAYDRLAASFDEFVKQVPGATRRNLIRRYMREGLLKDGKFVLEVRRETDAILETIPVFRQFSLAKFGMFSIWRLPWYVEWVQRCIKAASPMGWPRAWLLRDGQQPVAAMLTWIYRDAAFVYALSHDIARRHEDPGHVLLTRVISCLIDEGIKWVDIHTAEGYKAQYFSMRRPRHTLIVCPPGRPHDLPMAGAFAMRWIRGAARSCALGLNRIRVRLLSRSRPTRSCQQ